MLNFNQSDNLQVQGLNKAVKSVPGFSNTDQSTIQNAWNLARSKTEDAGVQETDPIYWDTVTTQAKTALGLQLPNTPKIDNPLEFQKQTLVDPMKTTANPQYSNGVVVESKVKETQDSSAFIGTVPENAAVPGFGGQTGPEINAESKKRLDLMKSRGFGSDF